MQLNQMHADDPCFSAILHLYSKGCSQGTNTINYPSHHQITRPTNHNILYIITETSGRPKSWSLPWHLQGLRPQTCAKNWRPWPGDGVASYKKKQSWLKTSIKWPKFQSVCILWSELPPNRQRRGKVPVTQIAKVPPFQCHKNSQCRRFRPWVIFHGPIPSGRHLTTCHAGLRVDQVGIFKALYTRGIVNEGMTIPTAPHKTNNPNIWTEQNCHTKDWFRKCVLYFETDFWRDSIICLK